MSKKTIILICVVISVLLIAGLGFYFFSTKSQTYLWRTVTVERGDVTIMVTSTGSLSADTSVDVGTQVTGVIAKIMVDFNSVVKKGQVIAVLDTALLYASKADADAAMQRAKYQLIEAKRELDLSKKMLDLNATNQSDYNLLLSNYEVAKGNLSSAVAQSSKANINLRYATIKAPISGMVIARNVQVGNMVIASFNSPTLFTIAFDLTKMQVQANVDEADIGQVKVGQNAKFTVDAYPNDVFAGVITQVRRQPVIVLNVVNYVVIVETPNPQMKLVPGLTANLNIYVEERKNILKVPSNAISFTPPVKYIQSAKLLSDSVRSKWEQKIKQDSELKKKEIVESNHTQGYIWIKKDQDIFPVQVTLSTSDGMFTEVSGNIKEGEEVVVGISHSSGDAAANDSKSPFMPKFPSRK